MSHTVSYFSPTTPAGSAWTVDVTSAVSTEGKPGFVDCAELGMVGMGAVLFDDPAGTLGHSGDAILGLKQLYVTEDDCAAGDQRLWTGYIGERKYTRSGAGITFPVGEGRVIDATILDVNSFLSFRVFQPADLDATSSFNRPAETAGERVTALLAVDFLSTTLFDLGLVDTTDTTSMSANDYTRGTPADVLNDLAQQSGNNFFVYYSEADNKLGLFYNSNDAAVYPAAADISNVAADIGTAVFAPNEDWVLARDPSRVYSGVLGSYKGGSIYASDLDTSYIYGYRDMAAEMSSVSGSAIAVTRAERYLAENATEDDRITLTLTLAAANVNKIKAGQYLNVRLTGAPGYSTARACRVLRREASQSERAVDVYTVRLELCPMIPPVTIVQQMNFAIGDAGSTSATWPSGIPSAAGNLIVCVARKRNSGGNTIPEFLDLYSLSSGTSINFTSWGEAEIRLGDILGSDRAKIMYATAVGDGRELTFVTTQNKFQYTLYEISGGTASGAEVLGPLSSQAGSGTKSLGGFSGAGLDALQIAAFLYNEGAYPETGGTGWTEDAQTLDPTTGGHPGSIVLHATTHPTASVSGGADEWGGLAVNIPHA